MLLGVSYLHILIAVIAGFCASTIDTIAGGGGMIIVPVLLYLGLSPATVLGTNRMAGFVSEITAICHFKGAKQLQFKQLWFGMLCAVVAAIIGSRLVQILHPAHMQKIMPILLALALIYFIFAKRFTQQHKHQARMNSWLFYSTVGLLIGFYNGFFGLAYAVGGNACQAIKC